jgi:hypothetical protein
MSASLKWLLTVPLTGVLLGCATSAEAPLTLYQMLDERELRLAEPVDRIYDYRISGWNYLDREHLILLDGASRKYLVTLKNPCHGLQSSEVIAHTSTVSTLTTFDKFLVRDVGGIVDQCYIQSLHRLEKSGAT